MNFWLKKSLLGIILLVLIFTLANYKDSLLLLTQIFGDNDSTATQTKTVGSPKDQPATKPAKNSTEAPGSTANKTNQEQNTNAAAEGLSKFYANIQGESGSSKGPVIRRNVVYLPGPEGDLEKLLSDRKMVTRPLPKNWQSDKASRPFRQGQTLHQKLSEYANQQGLEVIWWLNRDLLVKHSFRINEDIIRTAYQVGMAVNGHFENGVSTYFCYQHRAIVLTDQSKDYLAQECRLLSSKSGY